jgi:O-antigen ligase
VRKTSLQVNRNFSRFNEFSIISAQQKRYRSIAHVAMTIQPTTNGTFRFNSELVAFGFLAILMLFIPLSKAISSLAEALLAVSWIIGFSDAEIRNRRLNTLKSAPYLLLFPAFYLIYPLGLMYTTDLTEGLRELNMKHYFFSLPLLIGTLKLTRDQLRWLFLSFAISNVVVAVSVFYIIATGNEFLHGSLHVPSAFEQRPRASLFLCFSIFIVAEYLRSKWKELSNEAITTLFIFMGMLLTGLILMKGRIGQLGFVLLTPAFVVWYFQHSKRNMWRWVMAGALFVGLAAGMYFTFDAVRQPFDEAVNEFKESQLGYPTSEPTYSSIGQRVAFYEEYWPLFLENPWFGVGTGDLLRDGKPLFENQRFSIPFQRPHNQFFETMLKFGLFGLFALLSVWYFTFRAFYPGFRKLAWLFNLLLFVSMWSDSTLGTQAGISFFMAFNALFLVRPIDPVFVQTTEPETNQAPTAELLSDGLR